MITVDLHQAIQILQQGEILIYPTETLYGLGVHHAQETALKKLFALKGREAGKPVSLLVSGYGMLRAYVKEISPKVSKIIDKFLPGPLTLVLPAQASLSPTLTAGTGYVGIRWSSDPIAQRLVEAVGEPITSTSANPSGKPPAHRVAQVQEYFADSDVAFLSGGDLKPSKGSTVVQVEGEVLKLLREGEIPFTEILKIVS